MLGTGWYLWHAIKESVEMKRSEQQRSANKDFYSKSYFAHNKTEVQVKNAVHQIRNDYESLPQWAQGQINGLLHAVIEKMPDWSKDERAKLARELDKSEIDRKEPPWTFDVLAEHVAACPESRRHFLPRAGVERAVCTSRDP